VTLLGAHGSSFFRRPVAEKLVGGESSKAFKLVVHRAQQVPEDGFYFAVGGTGDLGTEVSNPVVEAARMHNCT
jgi:hypothetical protein